MQETADVTAVTVRALGAIADIPAAAWDACANPPPAETMLDHAESISSPREFNPFVSHAFLHALEASGCVGGRTGWVPRHLVATRGTEVVGVVPAYFKAHSQGEYVFDHGWADAYERAGGRYYPKLQIAVPFTPVPGPRLLVRAGLDADNTFDLLVRAVATLVADSNASSAHITFHDASQAERLQAAGFLARRDQQFHWHNAAYGTFADFLAALNSRKRKMIERERREALAPGITVDWVTGKDITEAHWDAFFAFYMDTGSRKWGRPYLNRRFFSLLGAGLADRILLVMAKRGGRPIAGALNLIGSHALFGRNWGAVEHHPFLHFEVCYYSAIDFAITHRLTRVEAGAQGEHKLSRGYLPAPTYSSHLIVDPRLRRAVADYLVRERAHADHALEVMTEMGPFRHAPAEVDA